MPSPKKAIGQRGSWYATVEGEELPCVHQHWFRGGEYNDIEAIPDDTRFAQLFKAIQAKGKAILTMRKQINTWCADSLDVPMMM